MKVLHILNGLNSGGVESFLLNLSKALEDSNVQMDFLLRIDKNDKNKIEFFKKRKSQIYYLPPFPKKIFKNYCELKKFLKANGSHYDVIHIHANSLVYFIPIKLSVRLCPTCKVIVHSHNTKGYSFMANLLHLFNRIRLEKLHVTRLACSDMAGKWMFKSDFEVLPNAINLDTYTVTMEEKKRLRQKYGIDQEKIIVFIGRLEKQKNPIFLVSVIKQLSLKYDNIHLIYAGDGSLKQKLKAEVNKAHLNNNIHLLGNYSNVSLLLKLADVYVMPSLYEGLSIAAIEAQCSGLPVILSQNVPKQTILCENAIRLELKEKEWARKIDDILTTPIFDENNYKLVKLSGYSLDSLKTKINKIYEKKEK